MRKYLLIALFALIVYFSYQPVTRVFFGTRGGRFQSGAPTCTYGGRTFHEQGQRRADDACNVCTCGIEGWTCTRMACLDRTPNTGMIAGSLAGPQAVDAPVQRVCAASLKGEDKVFCQQTTVGMRQFVLNVVPGDYWVYATRLDDESGKRAYWSEYVKCGMTDACRDHAPLTVSAVAGQIVRADPQDWSADLQLDQLMVTPSKWVYSTHNYYPTSVFLAKGRGLSSVTLMAKKYPPQEQAESFALGAMTLSSQDLGVQTWTLPVPQGGFQATEVYALGTSVTGETTKSQTLEIVRPIETTE